MTRKADARPTSSAPNPLPQEAAITQTSPTQQPASQHAGSPQPAAPPSSESRTRVRAAASPLTLWDNVRAALRARLGEMPYESWIKPLAFIGLGDGCAHLSAPTAFTKSYIERNYTHLLVEAFRGENAGVNRIDLRLAGVRSTQRSETASAALKSAHAAPAVKTAAPLASTREDEAAAYMREGVSGDARVAPSAEETTFDGAPLDRRFTFENFVVGKSNELAHAACRRVAEAEEVPFNPLYLHGETGLGKTHLMHAIAWEFRRRRPDARIIYLSAEKFMYHFVSALRYKTTFAFKERFRNVDVLMVDDFQFISGKDTTQEEFFHTFNTLVDNRRQVIISADRSPSDLQGVEDRIRSRLGWGLVADIHPTTYELRLSILQQKAAQMTAGMPGVVVENAVLEFLAQHITANIRVLEGALNRVIAHATLVGREITKDMAREVLIDVLRASERKISIEEIQKRVAEYYNIKMSDMASPRRARAVARPRQVAMYLAKRLTTRSLPEIGRKFGGRDHTTVMHAVKRIEELCDQDSTLREDVDVLRRKLEG